MRQPRAHSAAALRPSLGAAAPAACRPTLASRLLFPTYRGTSMQGRFSRTFLPLAAFALMAFAADTSVDYDHHADFSRYKTYSWLGVHASDLWQSRIQNAVDSQLQAKGWRRVESGGDATVSALGRVTE